MFDEDSPLSAQIASQKVTEFTPPYLDPSNTDNLKATLSRWKLQHDQVLTINKWHPPSYVWDEIAVVKISVAGKFASLLSAVITTSKGSIESSCGSSQMVLSSGIGSGFGVLDATANSSSLSSTPAFVDQARLSATYTAKPFIHLASTLSAT